jgi:nitroimidazol reductase NimA-like FMN-containing flavoprotein (pyridoxamine 5'-phosphate oxidase superfamily)
MEREKGDRMRLKSSLAKLVSWERICRVATASAAGVPHVVPVCHVLADGKLYFASETGARKVKNVRENPHVTLTVDLYSEDWSNLKGVMIQGDATIVAKSPRFRKIRRLLYAKYPQYPDMSAIGERDSVIVEVTPRHAFAWGMDD